MKQKIRAHGFRQWSEDMMAWGFPAVTGADGSSNESKASISKIENASGSFSYHCTNFCTQFRPKSISVVLCYTLLFKSLGLARFLNALKEVSYAHQTIYLIKNTVILWNSTAIELFSLFYYILICNLFLSCKAEFSAAITPVSSVTWFFRNYSNMLILLLKKHSLLLCLAYYYYHQCCKQLCCLIFLIFFCSDLFLFLYIYIYFWHFSFLFFCQKNSIYLKYKHLWHYKFDQFNVSLSIKVLITFKIKQKTNKSTDPKLLNGSPYLFMYEHRALGNRNKFLLCCVKLILILHSFYSQSL